MFTDPTGLAAKEFVKAYDEYLEIKALIYNKWLLDPRFLTLGVKLQFQLMWQLIEAEEKAKELHYARNQFNTNLPWNIDKLDINEWDYLLPTQSIFHTWWTPIFWINDKFISKDGEKEVVFNYKTGERDDSDENMGTYNFFNPLTDPDNHEKYDVNPYFEWWNSDNDTTSVIDRYKKVFRYSDAKIIELIN